MNCRKIAWAHWVAFSPYTLDFVSIECPPWFRLRDNGANLVRRDAAMRAARLKRRPIKREPEKKRRWP